MTTNGCSKKLCPMQVGTVNNCTLTKEQCPYFTQEIDYQNVLNQIKAAVAREIFAEIEKILEVDEYGEAKFDVRELYKIEKKYESEENKE